MTIDTKEEDYVQYARFRGASDNKGQHLAHLNAVEAYLQTHTPLPCDLTFIVEGEEEVGSPHIAAFVQENLALLSQARTSRSRSVPTAAGPSATSPAGIDLDADARACGPGRPR